MKPLLSLLLHYSGELITAGVALIIRQIELKIRAKKNLNKNLDIEIGE